MLEFAERFQSGAGRTCVRQTWHAWQRGARLPVGEAQLAHKAPPQDGDGSQVADELNDWIVEGEIDGFNLTRTVTPESYEDFIAYVVPALQDRGIYKTAYAEGSLRNRLFGEGNRLPPRHAGATFRAF